MANGTVPYGISSSSFIARIYAEKINRLYSASREKPYLGKKLGQVSNGHEPMYVLELEQAYETRIFDIKDIIFTLFWGRKNTRCTSIPIQIYTLRYLPKLSFTVAKQNAFKALSIWVY